LNVYRLVFTLAAAWNVLVGLWAACLPEAFLSAFGFPPSEQPWLWRVLGLGMFLYAGLYAYVACCLERGRLIVAIGLASKLLRPMLWIAAVASGNMPPQTFPLILLNDLVWWFPFLFYLLRTTAWRPSLVIWMGVVLHLLACLGLLAVREGTEAVADLDARARWIAQHAALWTATWTVWAAASMSLLALCAAWSDRLAQAAPIRFWAVWGCLIIATGVLCDLAGETIMIVQLTRRGLAPEEFASAARWYQLLSPAAANGLYCIGGLMLSALAWQTGWLRGGLGWLGITMWVVGLGLTVAALAQHLLGMSITGAAVMLLFIAWATALGWLMRPTAQR
jgi:small multidrug resistance pump